MLAGASLAVGSMYALLKSSPELARDVAFAYGLGKGNRAHRGGAGNLGGGDGEKRGVSGDERAGMRREGEGKGEGEGEFDAIDAIVGVDKGGDGGGYDGGGCRGDDVVDG